MQFLISTCIYYFNLLDQYYSVVRQNELLRCNLCILSKFVLGSFFQEGGDPVAYYPSIKGLPKAASFFVQSEEMEANILVAMDIIRERSEESLCRNVLPDEAFLLSNVIALEKKIKMYVVGVLSIEKLKKKS